MAAAVAASSEAAAATTTTTATATTAAAAAAAAAAAPRPVENLFEGDALSFEEAVLGARLPLLSLDALDVLVDDPAALPEAVELSLQIRGTARGGDQLVEAATLHLGRLDVLTHAI